MPHLQFGRARRALPVLALFAVAAVVGAGGSATATASSTGLVAAYSFDEGSGAVAHDLSGNGNDATLHNAAWVSAGKYGGAVSLNGTSSIVSVPDSPSLDPTSGLTIEAWVRAASFASSQTLVAKERPGGGFPYGLELDNGDPSGYTSSGRATAPSALPVKSWQFVATTYDGANLDVYVGGSLVASSPLSGALSTSTGQLSIGADSVWGEYFAGRIDNVRIYNRALSAGELQTDMNTAVTASGTTPPPPAPTPVAAYAFDEGTGMTASDSSGNGNTATLNGATWTTAGKYNDAASFGSSSIVTANDSASLDATSGVTLEAWVDPTAYAASQTVVAKEQAGGGFPYGLELDNGVPSAYAVTTTGTNPRATAPSALPLNTWSFVAAVYDGSALTVYVNGTAVASTSASGSLATSTGTLSIGADQQWGEHFVGAIDNVRVYASGVAASQVSSDMSTAIAGATPPPPPPPPGDTTPPSAPSGLTTSNVSQTGLTLSWTASTDNVGVTGYDVYVNGGKQGTTTSTSYGVTGLACGTTYTLAVDAYDAAGNVSPQSSTSATTSACSTSTGSTANLWIDKNGGSCTRSATPVAYSDTSACGSFQAAINAAQPGDTVLVTCNSGTSCTYPPETLSGNRGSSANVTIAAAPGYTISFEETAGSGTYVWLDDLHYVTFQNIGFGHNDSADSSPNLRIDCTRNVTLINSSGRRFYMFEGNANVTFQGGDWGNYSGAGEEDSTMGTTGAYGPAETCPGDSSPQPQRNIVFNGVTWHDVFWISSCTVVNGGQCSEWGGSHPDCFEINGYVDGVTIENSTFYHCGNTMLSLYTDQGNIDNVVAQNNTFRDNAPWSYYGIQWVTTANFTCSGDKFVNNTYTPNAPNGWFANTPPRFECASGGTPTVVSGNTIQSAPPSTECTTSKASPYLTSWQNNTFGSGSC
jgi:chitodextrinase